ncbi:hypothetical protein [Serratia marcescens]|uniref:hypothetical protein n=1 Tax=Serratia marcescens TaxID=615 RepID=UPI000D845E7E|nr:hypothetical protein [Serratia marcescens]PYA62687.1 hypothetical protein DMW52_02740 [Serratia marcescens]PYA88101.1 hypothetical protein DMW54_11800 [Serratia marcescens]
MTLTTEQLKARITHYRELAYRYGMSGNQKHEAQYRDDAAFLEELLANREAQPVAVTDEMALAFHRALNDGGIGESDLEEIKVGLRGALCNITAPPAPATKTFDEFWSSFKHPFAEDDELKTFSLVIWNACRAAMLAAAPEGGNG